MHIERQGEPGAVTLLVRGSLTVSRMRELHRELLAALAAAGEVTLEFGEVGEADLSLLQVVCAARRSADARGARFRVAAGTLPAAVRRLVAGAGAEGGPGDPAAGPDSGGGEP